MTPILKSFIFQYSKVKFLLPSKIHPFLIQCRQVRLCISRFSPEIRLTFVMQCLGPWQRSLSTCLPSSYYFAVYSPTPHLVLNLTEHLWLNLLYPHPFWTKVYIRSYSHRLDIKVSGVSSICLLSRFVGWNFTNLLRFYPTDGSYYKGSKPRK